MKKIIVITGLISIITLAGCGEAPVATLEPEGVETIITEEIITEEIVTNEIRVIPITVTSYEDVTTYWAD